MSWVELKKNYPMLCSCLENAKRNRKIAHAYLLVGDLQENLKKFALQWAQLISCINSNENGTYCGLCRPCKLFQKNAYTELYELAPQSRSRIITIQAIREFEGKVSLSSPAGWSKIGIIYDADCMGIDAQNAFLKTLEEPPKNTIFLLLSSRPRKLLNTIRSRCQTLLLLKNKQSYQYAQENGLFKLLNRLQRNKGLKNALEVAAEIKKILDSLKESAEKYVEDNWDERWEDTADENRALQRQLEELRKTRIDSEYVRLREELIEAMKVWFQQRLLITYSCKKEFLPQQELLKFYESNEPELEDAKQDLEWVDEFARCLKANVDETLALDTLCLSICEIIRE